MNKNIVSIKGTPYGLVFYFDTTQAGFGQVCAALEEKLLHSGDFFINAEYIIDQPSVFSEEELAIIEGIDVYKRQTQRSLMQAAKLLPFIDIEQITVHIFEDCSLTNMRLKGYCCSSMQLSCGGQLCYAVLDKQTIEKFGASPTDLSNICLLYTSRCV